MLRERRERVDELGKRAREFSSEHYSIRNTAHVDALLEGILNARVTD